MIKNQSKLDMEAHQQATYAGFLPAQGPRSLELPCQQGAKVGTTPG